MSQVPDTVFKLTAEGVDLEFAGSEAFVERQLQRFHGFLEGAMGLGAGPAAAAPRAAAAAAGAPQETPTGTTAAVAVAVAEDFATFCAERPARAGRGAIQDRILLAIYYMNVARKKRDANGGDVLFCFRQVGWEAPKNLHNALGVLKRKLGLLQEGSHRGLYQLSTAGLQYMESRYPGI